MLEQYGAPDRTLVRGDDIVLVQRHLDSERNRRLGRESANDINLVIYPNWNHSAVVVLDEHTGRSVAISREDVATTAFGLFEVAAKRWFDTHPELDGVEKPWLRARDRDVWTIATSDGGFTSAFIFTEDPAKLLTPHGDVILATDDNIVDGAKIDTIASR